MACSERNVVATAALTSLIAAVVAGATAQPDVVRASTAGDVFPFAVHERTLQNQLRTIVIPYDSPGIVSFYLIVRTGSRDEVEPGHSGFAHFFEHMMFRGTERYPTETPSCGPGAPPIVSGFTWTAGSTACRTSSSTSSDSSPG